MKTKNITEAHDPDLRASASALRRAAELARTTAIQTGTNLVIMRDGKLIRVSPQTLNGTVANAARRPT